MADLLDKEFKTLDTWGISPDIKKRFDKHVKTLPRNEALKKSVIDSLKHRLKLNDN